MTETTFNQYLAGAEAYYQEHKQHLRRGQAYMNYLGQTSEDLFHAVPWDLDPYHADKFLISFLSWLEQHWTHGKLKE